MQYKQSQKGLFSVSIPEIIELFKGLHNPEAKARKFLYVIGIIFTPVTLIGALWWYIRSYNRYIKEKGEVPQLSTLKPISRMAMMIGGVIIWVVIIGFALLASSVYGFFFGRSSGLLPYIIVVINLIVCIIVFKFFQRWQNKMTLLIDKGKTFGSARWLRQEELAEFRKERGIYIGGGATYSKQGHFLTMAGTRGGKLINLIAQNLLGLGGYSGSWFVIDVKGEITAITAKRQREMGNKVLVLDPWGISKETSAQYNPLDLLSTDRSNQDDLIDDVTVVAEMIVPEANEGDAFWSNRARTLISGLILHHVLTAEKGKANLTTIWKWLRLSEEGFEDLLADMATSQNAVVKATGNEFISALKTSDKMMGSIMAEALDKTDFLKSPALQRSMDSSSINIKEINDGKTTLYMIIPPGKLKSHFQWLRLVLTTSLRNVIQNKNQRITYLMDEFAALGYLPEVEVALSTYAGYNVTMWAIVQDLTQLKRIYGESWETFISNTAVRQFFAVGDLFSSQYISERLGQTTNLIYEDGKNAATARPLLTPDEVVRGSAYNIFTLIERKAPTYFAQIPYYEMPELKGLYDDNPYYNDTPAAGFRIKDKGANRKAVSS